MITVGSTGIRNLLVTIPAITNVVTENGSIKIFLGGAPSTFNRPYINIYHYTGGDENETPRRSFDIIYRVSAVAEQQSVASALALEIDTALVGSHLTYPFGWKSYAWVTQTGIWSDIEIIASKPYWSLGGFYRLRATK